MAEFFSLWNGRRSVSDELKKNLEEADNNRSLESTSALKIQRLFRGQFDRARIATQRFATLEIQRVYRGHHGRMAFLDKINEKDRKESMAIFHYHALIIQKQFRGFYSRRYYHDFHARKAYINSILEKSNALRTQLVENAEQQRLQHEADQARKAQEEFASVTQNLHHLVSTKSIAGVYNSPYMQEQLPTVLNVPVEDHLRHGVKELLRTRGRKKPVPSISERLSLQASSKYDLPEESLRFEKRYTKFKQMGAGANPFVAGGTGKAAGLKEYVAGISSSTMYLDPHKNPFNKRGADMSLVGGGGGGGGVANEDGRSPFISTVGGNKNPVLPGDRFDVLAETVAPPSLRAKALGPRAKLARTTFSSSSSNGVGGGGGSTATIAHSKSIGGGRTRRRKNKGGGGGEGGGVEGASKTAPVGGGGGMSR